MASELEQVIEAFKKANQAGNKEDARMFAQEAMRLEKRQSEQESRTPLGRAFSMIGSGLSTAGQAVGEGAQFLYEEARGPEGLPDLPEFKTPTPPVDKSLKEASAAARRNAAVEIGLVAATTPEQRRDIIQANFPKAKIETVEADGKQYYVVDYTDPDTGEQQRSYINAPGISGRDVKGVVGQGLAYLPAARLGRAGGLLTRAAKVGTGSAATSAGLDVAAQQAGAEEGVSLPRAGLAFGLGAGLETLSPLAAKVWRGIKGQSRFFNRSTGRLTDKGAEAARKAGLSDEDIADLDAYSRQQFAQFPEGGASPEVGARVARSGEFNIPLTKGQATQDYRRLNLEERMRKGMEGDAYQTALKGMEETQSRRVGEAAEGVQKRLAGGETRGLRESDAGEAVLGGVRSAARQLKQKVDEAYQGVRGEEFGISPGAAQRLPEMVGEALGDIDITPDLTPATARAQKVVGELVDAVSEGNGAKFETFRRRLGNLVGSANNPTDRMASKRIRDTFDEWVDEAVDQELFEGNPQALEMLKKARSLRREYGKKFEASDRQDTAGKIMDNIVRKAESPEEVVNYVFGQSALGRKQDTIKAVKRLKEAVGEDSEAWSAIREMAWLRMTRNRRGDWVGGKAFRNNFRELNNRNKSLMNEMFSKDEQRLMRRFSEAVELTDPPQTNPSGTAFGLENAIRYTIRRIGTRETFRGRAGSGTLFHFMARMKDLPFGVGSAIQSGVARRAVQTPRAPQPKAPGFVAGGTAAGQQANEAQRGQ